MTIKHLLGGVAAAALLTGATFAQEFVLDGLGQFLGQDIASEYEGALAGNLVVNLDFATASGVDFSVFGGAGVARLDIELTNARFTSVINSASLVTGFDFAGGCSFDGPTLGGGNQGSFVRFESDGAINSCNASGNRVSMPIEIIDVGQPASVSVAVSGVADFGPFTTVQHDLDLIDYAQGLEFEISMGAAGSGLFDFDGEDLLGSGIIGTTDGTVNAVNRNLTVGLLVASDMAASGTLAVTFPDGAEGIGSVNAGFGACTQGAAPNDNVFSCALTSGNLDAIVGGTQNITITDDGDDTTFVTAQTPTAELTIVSVADYNVAGDAGALADIELDDGLAVAAIANSNFDWVRFGSGGTESNFRIQLDDAAAAARVTEVRVAVEDGNNISAPTSPAYFVINEGAVGVGYQIRGATITFNSGALGEAAGAAGNANITGVSLQYTEGSPVTPLGGAAILRQLVNRTPGNFVATPGLPSDN